MPFRFRVLAPLLLASASVFLPLPAQAEGAHDSDWLIERWNGKWQLVTRGAAGRVEKTAPNQEVLRLGKDGTVLVMSMPALGEDETVLCFASKRRDYRSPCSSAFLECTNSADGAYVTLLNGVAGFNMEEVRRRQECRLNTNAVLRAAQAVGMISSILPVAEKPANPQ